MMKPARTALLLAAGATVAFAYMGCSAQPGSAPTKPEAAGTCATNDSGLSLPPGFCATIFADTVGHSRHMVVAPDGTVYVNTWSGRYFRNFPAVTGQFLVALRDKDGDGRAEVVQRFGPSAEEGGTGGTGIALYKGALYAEAGDSIVRYRLTAGQAVPTGKGEVVLSGMPMGGDHPMHPIAIDAKGGLFVNMGSATNACEEHNRQPGSRGLDPCHELETRAGIWRYEAEKNGQTFSPAERYATGIRNTGGISFDAAGRMFAVQHGRDQLGQNWPALYTSDQGVELPAEELISPTKGSDFGWPFCYYDGTQKRLVLAPEYGGDGGKAAGRCTTKQPPVAALPAHFGPNDVLVYTGTAFPNAYRGGAFIAFHGSWNRAPAPQGGYAILFQPLRDGKASGSPILFADGFAGAYKEPGRAEHRPAGVAMGPDGALYIADDSRGRIWRVTYKGSANAPLTPAPEVKVAAPVAAAGGATTGFGAQVELGRRIYLGEAKGGTCAGCHGSDGKGSSAGPALTGPAWLWADGSIPSLAKVIAAGVPNPKNGGGAMPPKGGADLTDDDVQAVASYVWTLGHPG